MQPTILVIEDDLALRELIAHDLTARGHNVMEADSAEDGLRLLRGERDVDVVLTDVRLAGMDGVSFCNEAKAIKPDLPVVVMTADASLESAAAATRAGAYEFVTKPFEIDKVLSVLDRAIGLHSLQREVARLRSQA